MNTAQTILHQLGGNRFALMTGAKNFLAAPDALHFKLPCNFAKDGINAVRVTLAGDDTYTVDYLRARGTSLKTVSCSSGIYCDRLQSDFSAVTGLATKL